MLKPKKATIYEINRIYLFFQPTAMKKILLTALAGLCTFIAYSQGTITGKVTDSTNSQPLSFATVTIFKAIDTSILTYRLTDTDGNFKVPGIPFGINSRVVISFSGYSVYRKEFTITPAQSVLDFGTITLTPETKSLDEVLIIAERPPIVVKKDTIEFNASAFKTLPNALVEDLLKKLPGVMVDKEGNISVNGRPVNRLLVDGKTFFGNDPKMATRNLPANVIDKVQVVDDKEQMAMNGDDDPNNVGKVINITLKKGVKKGWFGKIYAGGGSDERYEAGGIANIYRDTLQLSVLGYMNNLNRPGFSFSEIMSSGGFERVNSNLNNRSSSMWMNNGGSGISINGISFGGSQNNGGIATSKGAGFNLNHAPNKKQSLFLQYFYGNVKSPGIINTTADQFFEDTIISNQTNKNSLPVVNAHNIGIGGKFNPDSITTLQISANYMIGLRDETLLSTISTYNNKLGDLTAGNLSQDNNSESYNYGHTINFSRLSKTRAGRRFSFSNQVSVNNQRNDFVSISDMLILYPANKDSLYEQLRKEKMPATDITTQINYSEPINKSFTIRAGATYQYNKTKNDISTFNRLPGSDIFDVFNAALSSNFNRINHRVQLNAGIEYKLKEFTITPSLRYLYQGIDNELLSDDYTINQQLNKILPTLSIRYKQLTVSYSKNYSLPSFNMINPVADLSNPYNIRLGNPDLLPTATHSISANMYFNNQQKMLYVSGWFNLSFKNNDIVQSILVDEKGVQTSVPVNADNTSSYSMNWNINKQYKNKANVIFTWNTGNWTSITKNLLLYNNTSSWQTTFQVNQWSGVGLNLNDKFEWNISYSIGKNFTSYTSPLFTKLNVINHNLENGFVLRMPSHFIWETQLMYSYNGNIPAGLPKEAVRWNAALNLTMFKGEVGVLKLAVNDILARNNSIWVWANRNMVTTTHNNILGRYFLATFTYNIRPMVKKKVGGRESLFFF